MERENRNNLRGRFDYFGWLKLGGILLRFIIFLAEARKNRRHKQIQQFGVFFINPIEKIGRVGVPTGCGHKGSFILT